MNRILSIISLILLFNMSSMAKKKTNNTTIELKHWLQSEAAPISLPAFNDSMDIESEKFQLANLIKENYINLEELKPDENSTLAWNGKHLKWNKAILSKKGFLSTNGTNNQLNYFTTYIKVDEWSKAKLITKTFPMLEIYLDGKKISSHYNQENKVAKELNSNITLTPGKHCIIIKALSLNKKNTFKIQLQAEDGWNKNDFSTSTSAEQNITIKKILDGTKVTSSVLSADGKFVLLS